MEIKVCPHDGHTCKMKTCEKTRTFTEKPRLRDIWLGEGTIIQVRWFCPRTKSKD